MKLRNYLNIIFFTMIMLGIYFIWRNILVVVPLTYALAIEQSSLTVEHVERFTTIWLIANLSLTIGLLGYFINRLIFKIKKRRESEIRYCVECGKRISEHRLKRFKTTMTCSTKCSHARKRK